MTSFKSGDCVLLPFPFTDLSSIKQRPAVVISCGKFNDSGQDVIVAAITSHIPSRLENWDFLLNDSAVKDAGLPKTSMVKTGKIVTLDQRLVRRKIGTLPKASMHSIVQMIDSWLKLDG